MVAAGWYTVKVTYVLRSILVAWSKPLDAVHKKNEKMLEEEVEEEES